MSPTTQVPLNLSSILESIKDPLIARDLTGKILFANSAADKLYGYPQGELLGKSIDSITSDANKELEQKKVDSLIAGERVEDYETQRIDKHQKPIDVCISSFPLKDAEGKLIGITEIARNIGKSKRAEGKYQTLCETAPDALVVVNKFEQIVFINAEAEKLFGYEHNTLIGRGVYILIPKADQPEYREGLFAQAQHTKEPVELYGKKKDAVRFPLEICLRPVETEEGLLIAASIHDITERKEMKDYVTRLEKSNKELEQFAYIASHDLQEQLRNLTNYVALIEKYSKANTDEEFTFFMSVIAQSSDRMSTLISELLKFSRIGNNSEIEKVNCSNVLKEVLADFNEQIQESGAKIRVDDMPIIDSNSVEMKQVFENLLGNALKFKNKSEAPEIQVHCEDMNTEWKFSVTDNGIGIKEDYFKKIFLIFQQLHPAEEYPGIGTGLAVCKKIIACNRGDIWVSSKPGIGSTFFFTIPKNRVGIK